MGLLIRKKGRRGRRGTGAAAQPPAPPAELAWVDEFIASIRPYVRVRDEDNLLIRMPNVAHRLNDQGVKLLAFLLDGGSAGELAARVGEEHVAEVGLFLWEVKRCLDGTLREDNHSRAVEVAPLPVNFSSLPVLSEVAVTSRCNLSCVFCYAGCSCTSRPRDGGARDGDQGARPRDGGVSDMTTAEIKEVLERIYHDARVPSVSFTGGEPALRDDLQELVAFARELGFRVNLITNGTRVDRKLARRLARAGLHTAQVSLEGTSPASHDAITGVRGSFRRTVEGVAQLRDAGIGVHTNTTLNSMNIGDAPLMPRFVKRQLRLERFSMNMIIPAGTALDGSESLLLRYSEMGPLLKEVTQMSERAGVEFMWYSPTPLCIFNPITNGLGNKGCSACDGLLSVDAGGDVLPCSSFDETVGNLLLEDFNDIWQSARARTLRNKSLAPEGCRDCDNFSACHGACPLYWQRFGYGELNGEIPDSDTSLRQSLMELVS